MQRFSARVTHSRVIRACWAGSGMEEASSRQDVVIAPTRGSNLVGDDRDPLGVREFAAHHLPPEDAPRGYEIFRDKAEGCIKVVLQPSARAACLTVGATVRSR
jgi:hypothetical protein